MMEQFDQSNIERLINNMVTVLCQKSIPYSSEMHIQGTLRITIDASSMVLVQINEHFGHDVESTDVNASAPPQHVTSKVEVEERGQSGSRMSQHLLSSGVICVDSDDETENAADMNPDVSASVLNSVNNRQSPDAPHATVTSQCNSPQFHTGHVLSGGIPVKSETPQHVTSKVEVEERGQSGSRMSQHLLSSGVICVDSDDETENAAHMNPDVSASVLNSVSNRQSPDALQKILDTAVMAARAGNLIRLFWMLLPPPKKDVMFLVRSVCLSVCLSVRRITCKLVNGF